MIFLFCSGFGRRPTRFLLRFFARCRSLSDAFPRVVRTLANRQRKLYSFCFSTFFSFKTVGLLQVIHQPRYRPKQIRTGEYAVGSKIALERVKHVCWSEKQLCLLFTSKYNGCSRTGVATLPETLISEE
jgi:hypothetical protein